MPSPQTHLGKADPPQMGGGPATWILACLPVDLLAALAWATWGDFHPIGVVLFPIFILQILAYLTDGDGE